MAAAGDVYWITGLSGSGKSTIAKILYKNLRQNSDNIIYLDGDQLRKVFKSESQYSLNDRKQLAYQYSSLCQLLSEQGITVICACIALFHEVHQWNREHLTNYHEILLSVPDEVLYQRDQKQLYSRSLKGEAKNIMGIDLVPEYPKSPDAIIYNYGNTTPEIAVNEIIESIYGSMDAVSDTK